MSENTAIEWDAPLLAKISQMGDMPIPVPARLLEALYRQLGLSFEVQEDEREIDAMALEALIMAARERGAMARLIARLHSEGVLSEGQIASALDLHRIEVRRLLDGVQHDGVPT